MRIGIGLRMELSALTLVSILVAAHLAYATTVGELTPSDPPNYTLSFPLSAQTVMQGTPVRIFTEALTYPYTTAINNSSYVRFMGNLNLTPGSVVPTGVTYTWESSTSAAPPCPALPGNNTDPHTIDAATLSAYTPNHGVVGRLKYSGDPTAGTLYITGCLSVAGASTASVTVNGNGGNNSLSVIQAQWKTKPYIDGSSNDWAGAQSLEVLPTLGITAPTSIPNNNTWEPVARASYPLLYSLAGGAQIPIQASGLQELQYQSGAYPESVAYQLQVFTSTPTSNCTGSGGSQVVTVDSSTNSYGMPFSLNSDWDMKINNGFIWTVPSGGLTSGTTIYLQLCVEALSSDNNGNIVLKSFSGVGSGSATLAELFLPGNVTTYPSKYYPSGVELTNTAGKSAMGSTWGTVASGIMTIQSSLIDNTLDHNLQTDGVVVLENDTGTPGSANYRFQIGGNTGCTTNEFVTTAYSVTVPPSSSGFVDVGINDLEQMGTTSPFVSSSGSCKIALQMEHTGGAAIHVDPQATHFNSVLENDAVR